RRQFVHRSDADARLKQRSHNQHRHMKPGPGNHAPLHEISSTPPGILPEFCQKICRNIISFELMQESGGKTQPAIPYFSPKQ
ncbi:MAG: hypothetical protein QGI77_05160, partial [Roseibacillus sp.]|nr:hypothetical protein [Roseibacillus sp.]